jgi:hypothetical protein
MAAAILCASAPLSGCHIIAGFSELELREDPEPTWDLRMGDELPQTVNDIAAYLDDGLLIGEYQGVIELDRTLESVGGTDVFVTSLDNDGRARWSFSLGGVGDERGRAIATSRDGVSIAGIFGGELAVGAQTLTAAGTESFFLANVHPDDGSLSGAQSFGGADFGMLGAKLDVARVDEENVVVGGFSGTLDLGCADQGEYQARGPLDVFVAKFDADGACAWSHHWGDTNLQAAESVGNDIGRNVVLAGEFAGMLDFGGAKVLTSSGGIDIFVAKLTPDGEPLWVRQFGNNSGLQAGVRVAVHGLGNVAIAGFFDGSIDFGGGPMSSSNGHDVYVAKFDPSGNFLWSKHFPMRRERCDPANCQLDRVDLVVDGQGDLVLTGHFVGTVDFGGTPLTSETDADMYVAKLDVDGELLWSGSFTGGSAPLCQPPNCYAAAAITRGDKVLLSGYFDNRVDFGLGALTSAGDHDAFVLKLAP